MTSTGPETVLGNARIVLADRVIERGWIAFADGRIAEYGEGDAPSASEDAGGDLIMPGLIELHTDHLEAHYVPRPTREQKALCRLLTEIGAISGFDAKGRAIADEGTLCRSPQERGRQSSRFHALALSAIRPGDLCGHASELILAGATCWRQPAMRCFPVRERRRSNRRSRRGPAAMTLSRVCRCAAGWT